MAGENRYRDFAVGPTRSLQSLSIAFSDFSESAAVNASKGRGAARMVIKRLLLGCAVALAFFPVTQAAITAEEAAKLGTELTPLGADPNGNAEGTIPPWTGGITTPPPGYVAGSGDYIDPFADEEPLYVITAANMDQYDQYLTDGIKALLRQYPETFKVPVYKSHRTAAFPQHVYDDIKRDSQRVELFDGGDSIRKVGRARTLFPIPKNGYEVIWSSLTKYNGDDIILRYASFPVQSNGRYTKAIAQEHRIHSPVIEGDGDEGWGGKVFYEMFAPASNAGYKIISYSPWNYTQSARQSWAYNPGQRRVLRAPEISYDTPIAGSDGLITNDTTNCWTGATDRYDFTLVGKQEKLIPYNNYKLNSLQTEVSDIVGKHHVNPDLMRYELHRVWVVDATLKEGKRNVFGKRRYYFDEDSFTCAGGDLYDNRGQLWRVIVSSMIQMYDVPMFMQRAETHYDLQARRYMIQYVANEEGPYKIGNGATSADFTIGRLRRSGR